MWCNWGACCPVSFLAFLAIRSPFFFSQIDACLLTPLGDGKCVICDSYVRPCTLVRICDECNYGSYQGLPIAASSVFFCSVSCSWGAHHRMPASIIPRSASASHHFQAAASSVVVLAYQMPTTARSAPSRRKMYVQRAKWSLCVCVCVCVSVCVCVCVCVCVRVRVCSWLLWHGGFARQQRDGCPKIVNLGAAKTDMFYERKKYGFKPK